MATFNAVWWGKYHTDKKGFAPVKIRINTGDQQRYLNLNFKLTKQFWNPETCRVDKSHPCHRELNIAIQTALNDLQIDGLQGFSAERLKNNKVKKTNSFFSYAGRILSSYKSDEQLNTIVSYQATISLVNQCFGADVRLTDIDFRWVREFKAFLSTHGAKDSTIKIRMAFLRMVFRKAVDDGILPFKGNPFRSLGLKNSTSRKEFLTLEELNLLRSFEFTGKYASAVDAFLLSFNIRGIRASDVVTFNQTNIESGRIIFVTAKDDEPISCSLTPEASAIIERCNKTGFLFPFLVGEPSRANINKAVSSYRTHLVQAGLQCGLTKHLTPHVARHTWTNMAVNAGVDLHKIQHSLGHSDIKTTQVYAHGFSDNELDRINNIVTSNR